MHLFKKTIFTLFLFLSSLATAQDASEKILDQFNDLANYIPKSLEKDTIYTPEIRISKLPFNSISSVKLHNVIRHFSTLTPKEITWLEKKISTLAIALHAEGKYFLVGQIGGAGGCHAEGLIEILYLNTIKITRLNFCHGCTDSYLDKEFVEIFNSKMYQLLHIKRSDLKTHLFYGTYTGKGKNASKIELTLTKERIFTLQITKNDAVEFSEGIWKNENDTLILTSKKVNQSNINTFELNVVKFRLKNPYGKSKLLKLAPKKWKLKKIS